LGVGGLAVALALQDTLTNLFAGVHITVARIIKAGDYVMLSSGEEGTVSDITWRVTTLLTTSNNIVIIPNSKLASSIVTNYSLPAKNMDMALPIHVGYNADLEKVEKITLEVAIEVMKELGIENAAPVVRYREFAPSAINLNLWITIHIFTDQPSIRHALMKRIYRRYKQEGIEISLPESTVHIAPPQPSPMGREK
jgi:small-conductance mechanosensitive channel